MRRRDKSKRANAGREPTGGAVFVHDPDARIMRVLTDLRPQDKPTVVYGGLAEALRDNRQQILFGFGILRELEAELGSYDAVWAWVGSLAVRLGRPVLCNVPDGDGSVTVTVAPPDWTPERLKGYVAGRHEELERAYGRISHLVEPDREGGNRW